MVTYAIVLIFQCLMLVSASKHQECENLNAKIDAVLQQNEKIIEENRELKAHLRRKQARQIYGWTVAFTAQLTPINYQIGGNQQITYDHVVTNIGNGYSSQNGMFTAPISGLYHFSTTVMAVGNENVHIQMVKNGNEIARAYTSSTDYETGVAVVIIELNKGDTVWVKHFYDVGAPHIHGLGYTSFSGFLITPIE